MLAGCLVLLAGTGVTLAAIEMSSAAAFLTGTAVAGAGFGTAMLGAFRTISALAAPGQRASLIAAYLIVSYLAFSIPVVVAGSLGWADRGVSSGRGRWSGPGLSTRSSVLWRLPCKRPSSPRPIWPER